MLPLLLFILWIGIYPQPFLRRMDASVNAFVTRFEAKKQAALAGSPAGETMLVRYFDLKKGRDDAIPFDKAALIQGSTASSRSCRHRHGDRGPAGRPGPPGAREEDAVPPRDRGTAVAILAALSLGPGGSTGSRE